VLASRPAFMTRKSHGAICGPWCPSGEIERDPAQEALLGPAAVLGPTSFPHRLASKVILARLVVRWARAHEEEPIRGLYIFGDVGRGKKMLMVIFLERRARFRAEAAP